jgi:hypothetical protein
MTMNAHPADLLNIVTLMKHRRVVGSCAWIVLVKHIVLIFFKFHCPASLTLCFVNRLTPLFNLISK